jgi:hypothetical protein
MCAVLFQFSPPLESLVDLERHVDRSPLEAALRRAAQVKRLSGLRQRDRNGQILEENRAGIAEIPEPSFVNRSPGIGHRNPHTGRALTGVEIDSALDEKEFGAATPRVTFQAN